MNAIETLIYTLEMQLKTMPSGYVKETVTACKELAEGIKEIYENPDNNFSNQPNKDYPTNRSRLQRHNPK